VVNAAGLYTLTVSYTAPDGTVCEKMAAINVVLNPNPLSAWITPPAPLGCGSTTTTLIGNSNQSGFSVFAWETLDGNIVSGANQKNCVVNQVGTLCTHRYQYQYGLYFNGGNTRSSDHHAARSHRTGLGYAHLLSRYHHALFHGLFHGL
jgi:hypothetical protein